MKSISQSILLLLGIFLNISLCQVHEKGVELIELDKERQGTIRAVVIGISEYQNIESLNYADDDAVAFYNFLISQTGYKIDASYIRLLLNNEATQGNIYRELIWLMAESEPYDEAIIYFSGHGDIETETIIQNGFLLAYDCPKSVYYAGGAIQVENLKAFTMTMTSKNVKVILFADACRSGFLAGGIKGVELTNASLKQQWQNETKVLSSKPGELSYESSKWGNGRGVFSYYLVNGLVGLADSDNDKIVTAFELQNYLYTNVKKETYPLNQTPIITGDPDADIGKVDPVLFAEYEERKNNPNSELLSVLDTGKGFELEIDTLYKVEYHSFDKALKENRLIEPKDDCAYFYYKNLLLSGDDRLIRYINRNLGAALQNEAQKVINAYLVEDYYDSNSYFKNASELMKIAIDLLGESHPLYKSYKARQLFLEARSYAHTNKDSLKKAISLLERSVELEPTAAYSFNTIGLMYADLGNMYGNNEDIKQSITYFQKTIEFAPKWVIPFANIISAYNNLRDYTSAIAMGAKAVALNPKYVNTYILLAESFGFMGEREKAVSYAEKAVELNPDNIDSWIALGGVYNMFGDYNKAQNYIQKAIELNPDISLAYYVLANTYSNMQDYQNAKINYEKAIKLNPEDYSYYFNLGNTNFLGLYDYNAALYNYQKTLELNPNYSDAVLNLGNLYFVMEVYEKAMENYIRYEKLVPDDPVVYNLRANLYAKIRDYENAISLATKYLEFKNDDPGGYYNLACYYSLVGKKSESLEYLEKSIQKGFDNFEYIENDTDLDNVRNEDNFKILMDKYEKQKLRSEKKN
ncbi:MAG: tetratricopeptide repeat protein [bacterium]